MQLELMEIEPKIFFIRGEKQGSFPFSNSLIIKGKLILDLGVGIEIVKDLVGKVEFAALTHTHPDHCGGAWIFNEKSKKVLSPEGYETKLESLVSRFVDLGIKEDWKRFVSTSMGLRDFEAEYLLIKRENQINNFCNFLKRIDEDAKLKITNKRKYRSTNN